MHAKFASSIISIHLYIGLKMKIQSKLTTLVVATAMLTGCAASNNNRVVSTNDGYRQFGNVTWDKTGMAIDGFDDSIIPANQSRLVFIRSKAVADMQSSGNIGIDNRFQVSLQNSNYSSVYACAGEHKINIKPTGAKTNNLNQEAVTYDADAGTTHYYYIDLDNNGVPKLASITKEDASTLLQNSSHAQQTHQISRMIAQNCIPPAPVPEKPTVVIELDKPITLHVEFDFDKATIRPQYNERLIAVAKFMAERPNTVALIEGHTDSRGSDSYNLNLSERRAAAVRQQLVVRYGVDSSRITSAGFGESRPIATNETDEGRQSNRRVDALITLKK